MIGRFGELPKERLDRPTLLGAIGSDDMIAFRPIDLDRPERRGDAVEAELPAACRPQVSDPLRLATARHELADAVNLEGAAERYGPRLVRLPTRHDEHERSPRVAARSGLSGVPSGTRNERTAEVAHSRAPPASDPTPRQGSAEPGDGLVAAHRWHRQEAHDHLGWHARAARDEGGDAPWIVAAAPEGSSPQPRPHGERLSVDLWPPGRSMRPFFSSANTYCHGPPSRFDATRTCRAAQGPSAPISTPGLCTFAGFRGRRGSARHVPPAHRQSAERHASDGQQEARRDSGEVPGSDHRLAYVCGQGQLVDPTPASAAG